MTDSSTNPERTHQIRTILAQVVRLSRMVAAPRSTPFGDTALTRTQLDILFVLAHSDEPVTPGRLADILQVTPGAITQTVEQLRSVGLVDQTALASDGRSRLLRLTDTAAERVDAFETAKVVGAAQWFGELSNDELTDIAALLSKVKDIQ
ncbi:MarR family transcriptional regulator [Arthrobacter sp. H20]|uniref:MarR family winged helix-turn-helix transcriptional regulator n=1 Tax=Arthrobacter sp. H20 TaxID=1267981 RepID=UPI000684E99B|nr:MarR family transcriptional regulator [Arthrobacter sp. H20]